jgi:hypothetical protein
MAVNDADDLSMPDRLAKQVAYMETHPECVLLGSRVMQMDPFDSPIHVTGQKLTHEEIEQELLGNGGGWALVQSAIMVRVDVARQIGGYRGEEHNLAEDHDLFVRLAEVGQGRQPRGAARVVPAAPQQPDAHAVSGEEAEARAGEGVDPEGRVRAPRADDARDLDVRALAPHPAAGAEPAVGWAALKRGNVAVARRHAADALKHGPLSLQSWKLMACALRGR